MAVLCNFLMLLSPCHPMSLALQHLLAWTWTRSQGWGRRSRRRWWRRSNHRRVLWKAMRVGEWMWCENRLDGVGKGRGNGCFHLPSLGDIPAVRRHAYVPGVGPGWHAEDAMNSLSINKFTQTQRKRLVNSLSTSEFPQTRRKRFMSKSKECTEYITSLWKI
jgi:hypothetical protein